MSEALFLRGITPWTPSADLDRPAVAALVDLAYRLIHANRDRAVQVTTGDTRPGRSNWVHARSGRSCRRCGTGVRVAMIGVAPHDRTAFYCPHCQRGPHPTDDGRPQAPLGAGRRRRNDRLP
jgi:endonuclease-8